MERVNRLDVASKDFLTLCDYAKTIAPMDFNDETNRADHLLETFSNIFPEVKVGELACHRIIGCLEPHDDEHFTSEMGFSCSVYFIVLDVNHGEKTYKQTMEHPMFYSNGNFLPMFKGDVFWFNSLDEHAILNNGVVDLLVVWQTPEQADDNPMLMRKKAWLKKKSSESSLQVNP